MKTILIVAIISIMLIAIPYSCKKQDFVPDTQTLIDTISIAQADRFNQAVSNFTSIPQQEAINAPEANGNAYDTALSKYQNLYCSSRKNCSGF